jgi:hypothetical protein
MTDRFSPNQNKLRKIIDDLVSNLSGNEDLFVNAYSEAADLDSKSKPKSIEDVKRELRGIFIVPGVPWVFF